EGGTVGGRRVELSAGAAIGSSSRPLLTSVTDTQVSGLLATTTSGPISIHEVAGSLAVDRIAAGGGNDVTLSSNGLIRVGQPSTTTYYEGLVAGGAITIDVDSAGLGASDKPIVLDSGTQLRDVVDVTASGDVFLRE